MLFVVFEVYVPIFIQYLVENEGCKTFFGLIGRELKGRVVDVRRVLLNRKDQASQLSNPEKVNLPKKEPPASPVREEVETSSLMRREDESLSSCRVTPCVHDAAYLAAMIDCARSCC